MEHNLTNFTREWIRKTEDFNKEQVKIFVDRGGYSSINNRKANPSPMNGGRNLTELFRTWLDECFGTFTIDQIYKDLCITSLKEKNLIRVNLSRELVKGSIERGRIQGQYLKIYNRTEALQILGDIPQPMDLKFPGEIEDHVSFYPIILKLSAGSPNAGKTALSLNFALSQVGLVRGYLWFLRANGSEELR